MTRIGHRREALLPGAAAALAALVGALAMWGFTVDDALISVRYARNLAAGHGWRFDLGGPPTDGVTPLPWPLFVAPLGRLPPLAALDVLRAAGAVAWVAAASRVGAAIGRSVGPRGLAIGLALTVGTSLPLAAHAVSGMETAFATLFATLAVTSTARPFRAAALAGLAATLRPELAPWACALALGAGASAATGDAARRAARGALAAAVAAAPPLAVAFTRLAIFGAPYPLALRAKPSDLAHGLAYAGAALVVAGAPLLLAAPRSIARSPRALTITAAFVCHVAVVALVGGDWMPYARLVVPVLPGLWVVAGEVCDRAPPWMTGARAAIAAAIGLTFFVRAGPAGRGVARDRAALVGIAAPALDGASCVATLDAGWVGAAAPRARVVDLAGVTDPEIAALPGGHTSKRVDVSMLVARGVDAVVVYAPGGEAAGPVRVAELRLASSPLFERRFTRAAFLPLGGGGGGYVLYRARPPAAEP